MKTAMQELAETLSKEIKEFTEIHANSVDTIYELRRIKFTTEGLQIALNYCIHQIEKERQQIEWAYSDGLHDGINKMNQTLAKNSQDYFNQTYKNESE